MASTFDTMQILTLIVFLTLFAIMMLGGAMYAAHKGDDDMGIR